MFSEDPSKEGGGPPDHQGEDVSLPDSLPEVGRAQPEDGEAIVVGVVGSAAPWFLMGWANDMEVEFMIDTGCQVTILATTVFERMFTAGPMVQSRLRPCRRRLVSADSSPLTVKGELWGAKRSLTGVELICCLWWLVLDRTACWAWKPCSHACHISWIFERDTYWRTADQHYN